MYSCKEYYYEEIKPQIQDFKQQLKNDEESLSLRILQLTNQILYLTFIYSFINLLNPISDIVGHVLNIIGIAIIICLKELSKKKIPPFFNEILNETSFYKLKLSTNIRLFLGLIFTNILFLTPKFLNKFNNEKYE